MATALVTAACGVSDPDDGTPTLDQRVTVLPDVTGMVVDATSIQVPRAGNESLAHLADGSIVVSTHGEGLLRRVDGTTLTADSITLATSDAELTEAIIDGQVATSLGGDGKADTYQLPGIAFGVQNQAIVQNAAITATLTSASLSFRPELDLDLSISGHSVDSFAMVMRGRIEGDIDLDIVAHEADIGPEIRLWESPPMTFYQQVGVLPVVETVTTSVVLHLQVLTRGEGHVKLDAGALAQIEGGIRYTDDGGWDGVADASLSTHGSVPEASATLSALGVRAWLAIRTDVRMYGVAGPFVAAGPQAQVLKNVNGAAWDASVGVRASAGGGLKFLAFNLPASPAFDLFDVTHPLL